MRNAVYGIRLNQKVLYMNEGYLTNVKSVNTMAEGATPNVTMSARESSYTPIGPDTPRARADSPSKKSKKAPRRIKRNAVVNKWWKAAPVAMHPQTKLQQVMVLGICFVKLIVSIVNHSFLLC